MDPSIPPFVTSAKRLTNKPDWIITSDEVEQGCILWLGTLAETFESQRRRGSASMPVVNVRKRLPANEGMYEHPFLVLSRPESHPSKIQFLPMTSLGGQTLATKFTSRKASYHQSTFLPITPAKPHPLYLTGNTRFLTLTLENGDHLEKSTYVNVRELYEMDWRDAQLYWGSNPSLRKKWKLDGPSMQAVMGLVKGNLKVSVGRQFSPSLYVSPISPFQGYANVRSHLLAPLNRRLSNHAGNISRSRTTYQPSSSAYLPATSPGPFVVRSSTSPPSYRIHNTYPPAIHPALQAEFSPPRSPEHGRGRRSMEVPQAVEERQPLLNSDNPQIPEQAKQAGDNDDYDTSVDDWTCEFWRLLCCRCW